MTISNSICKTNEFDDSIFYKAHCTCTSDRHIQTLQLSYEQDIDDIMLTIWSQIWTNYKHYDDDNLIRKIKLWYLSKKNKWKQVIKLILTDQIEGENEFLFGSEQQVVDYIEALQYGLCKMRQSKYNHEQKQQYLNSEDTGC